MQNILRSKSTRALFAIFAVACVLFSPLSVQADDAPPNTKAFTLTKKAASATTEETVGEYDTFFTAIDSMDINDKTSLYTVYVNKNTVVPASEGFHGRSNNKIRLTSGKGGPYTLTRKGSKEFIGLMTDAELTVENITLDGSNESECFSVLTGAKATIGKGATIQNFADLKAFDGPAIYVIGGTLTIEDGAVIKNNTSNDQGGIIQGRQDSIINIKGGIFENNSTTKSQGGALAAYGKLHITGGTFKGNKAPKVGGAIIVGQTHPATIENATFIGNKASTGGAIYSPQEVTFKNTKFENNKANWGAGVYSTKKLTISGSTFTGNKSNNDGGALYLDKDNGAATITDSKFIDNSAAKNGGAIFTWKFDSSDPITKNDAYQNITTDNKTLFKGNTANAGKHTPPANFADYTSLLFSSESDAAQANNFRKSLLNNYDLNYQNAYKYVTFKNGDSLYAITKVEPGKSINGDALADDKMPANPTKDGHTFKEWNTQENGKGTAFTGDTAVNESMTVYAVYTKNPTPPNPPAPQPNPQPNPPAPQPNPEPNPQPDAQPNPPAPQLNHPSVPDSQSSTRQNSSEKQLPKTGDSFSLNALVIALGFSIAGVAILRKKKLMA